jgi:hypothetical protein
MKNISYRWVMVGIIICALFIALFRTGEKAKAAAEEAAMWKAQYGMAATEHYKEQGWVVYDTNGDAIPDSVSKPKLGIGMTVTK